MTFFFIAIVAIVLYALGYKVPALVIFFFCLTSGFDLVPYDTGKKFLSTDIKDFSALILVGMIAIDVFFVKNYLKPDTMIWLCLIFFGFLGVCVLYNRSAIGVGIGESFQTLRYNIPWASYLVFRNMKSEELKQLLKYLFLATVFCSVLYVLQIVFNTTILNEALVGNTTFLGIQAPRFYNQPAMIVFFTYMALYKNPFHGITRIITTAILLAAYLGAFHRNLWAGLILALAVGYLLKLPRLTRIRVVAVSSVILLIVLVFAGMKFAKSQTFSDIKDVITGNFDYMDINASEFGESTFTYRIAHLLERNQYLLDNPKAMLFGGGLMKEDSKLTFSLFEFDLGLANEITGDIAQLSTPDISYSILLIRYGYLGAALNLLLFIYLAVVGYKHRDNKYGFLTFIFFIVSFVVSWFSWNLVQPVTFALPLACYCIINKDSENEKQNNSIGIGSGL
jgi:hypothetical protein